MDPWRSMDPWGSTDLRGAPGFTNPAAAPWIPGAPQTSGAPWIPGLGTPRIPETLGTTSHRGAMDFGGWWCRGLSRSLKRKVAGSNPIVTNPERGALRFQLS